MGMRLPSKPCSTPPSGASRLADDDHDPCQRTVSAESKQFVQHLGSLVALGEANSGHLADLEAFGPEWADGTTRGPTVSAFALHTSDFFNSIDPIRTCHSTARDLGHPASHIHSQYVYNIVIP